MTERLLRQNDARHRPRRIKVAARKGRLPHVLSVRGHRVSRDRAKPGVCSLYREERLEPILGEERNESVASHHRELAAPLDHCRVPCVRSHDGLSRALALASQPECCALAPCFEGVPSKVGLLPLAPLSRGPAVMHQLFGHPHLAGRILAKPMSGLSHFLRTGTPPNCHGELVPCTVTTGGKQAQSRAYTRSDTQRRPLLPLRH